MRSEIMQIIAEREATLRKLREIAVTLPLTGPTPWLISDLNQGAFHFSGPHQVDRVHRAFGHAGWRRMGNEGGAISHVKQLHNGVTAIIENAEVIVAIDEPIEVASAS